MTFSFYIALILIFAGTINVGAFAFFPYLAPYLFVLSVLFYQSIALKHLIVGAFFLFLINFFGAYYTKNPEIFFQHKGETIYAKDDLCIKRYYHFESTSNQLRFYRLIDDYIDQCQKIIKKNYPPEEGSEQAMLIKKGEPFLVQKIKEGTNELSHVYQLELKSRDGLVTYNLSNGGSKYNPIKTFFVWKNNSDVIDRDFIPWIFYHPPKWLYFSLFYSPFFIALIFVQKKNRENMKEKLKDNSNEIS